MTDIIRNNTNYGNLAVIELDGKRFLLEKRYAEILKLPMLEEEEIPEFNMALTIRVMFPNGRNEAWAHVLSTADVRSVVPALSKFTGYDVRVCGLGCILAIYEDGKMGIERKITSFYTNLTQEQIASVTF